MKSSFLLVAALGSLAIASPVRQEKRQLPLPIGMIGVPGVHTTFDYIVVGGGTAGITIAKRLAEDSSVTVAVVEAGTFYQVSEPLIAETPGGDTTFVGTKETEPTVDWGFFTNPDPASNNVKRSYARGKCLGGRYEVPIVGVSILIFSALQGTL
jgi:choline dehydrogenase